MDLKEYNFRERMQKRKQYYRLQNFDSYDCVFSTFLTNKQRHLAISKKNFCKWESVEEKKMFNAKVARMKSLYNGKAMGLNDKTKTANPSLMVFIDEAQFYREQAYIRQKPKKERENAYVTSNMADHEGLACAETNWFSQGTCWQFCFFEWTSKSLNKYVVYCFVQNGWDPLPLSF